MSSFQSIPNYVFAENKENNVLTDIYENEAIIVAENDEAESVDLYEDQNGEVIKTTIPTQSLVYYANFDENDSFVQVQYENLEQGKIVEGYVHQDFLLHNENVEEKDNSKDEQANKEEQAEHSENEAEQSDEKAESAEQQREEQDEQALDDDSEAVQQEDRTDEDEQQEQSTANEQENDETTLEEAKTQTAVLAKESTKRLNGIALKSPTNVYEEKSTDANVLKDYQQGSILIFYTGEDDWYQATVYINGVAHKGYIFAEDVDIIDGDDSRKEGQALLPTVSVYDRPSKEGKSLKNYSYGHTLVYRTFSSQWHKATVFINGERHTGYIFDQDVSPAVQGEDIGERLSGAGLKDPTNVYELMSRSSKVLKSYRQGHILKFREYEPNWYIATVYVNGEAKTGYIHQDDVQTGDTGNNDSENNDTGNNDNVSSLRGYAQKAPTHVYSDTSRQSMSLKSYPAGRQLIYRPYDSNWYRATVYINGERHTGYIHHDDVGTTNPSMENYALKQPTHVYASTSRNSQPLKSYKQGHLLKFREYNETWYQATIYVNGIAKTGYIHHDDVGELPSQPAPQPGKTVVIDAGHGGKDPGASGNGIIEKSLALSLSKLAQKMLEDAGVNVIMTRETDEYLTLNERSQKANRSNADLFLSIHGNAFNGSVSGIETYWHDKYAASESKRLAENIQREVIRKTNARDRGVKKGNFHVVRETQIPSALLEVGFVDHPGEAEKLKQEGYQKSLIQGVVDGILSFLK